MSLSDKWFWILWTAFSGCWMVLVAYVTITSYQQNKFEIELLTQQGMWTQATVVDRETKVEYDDDGYSTTYYYLMVEYLASDPELAGDKRTYSHHDAVDEAMFDQYEVGQQADIIYAVDTPHIYRLREEFRPPDNVDFTIAICAPLFGLPFFLLGLWMMKRELA